MRTAAGRGDGMVRPRSLPPPTFAPVRHPPRVILVSASLTAFCEAIYTRGLRPHLTYRAETMAQAERMQRDWWARGIESWIEVLAVQGGSDHEAMADALPTDLVQGRAARTLSDY